MAVSRSASSVCLNLKKNPCKITSLWEVLNSLNHYPVSFLFKAIFLIPSFLLLGEDMCQRRKKILWFAKQDRREHNLVLIQTLNSFIWFPRYNYLFGSILLHFPEDCFQLSSKKRFLFKDIIYKSVTSWNQSCFFQQKIQFILYEFQGAPQGRRMKGVKVFLLLLDFSPLKERYTLYFSLSFLCPLLFFLFRDSQKEKLKGILKESDYRNLFLPLFCFGGR